MGHSSSPLLQALKRAASCLKQAELPFALAGGYAVFARGGPQSEHDVDFLIRGRDVEAAVAALAECGFRIERPPEDWLVKAYDGDSMIDLIHRPVRREVDDEMLGRAAEIEVGAIVMPVLDASDLMVLKLRSLSEHHCDMSPVLAIVRAVREQVDWELVREETQDSPFASAALHLAQGLDLIPPSTAKELQLHVAKPTRDVS
jgi:predicted nucleotidyltransferase